MPHTRDRQQSFSEAVRDKIRKSHRETSKNTHKHGKRSNNKTRKNMGMGQKDHKGRVVRDSIKINDKLDTFDPNIFVKHHGDGKMIPKFHIVNSPSFASVVITLKQGQSVFCNYGALNYMDGGIDVSTKSDGFFSGLIRSFFTTTSMFLTYYTGTRMGESVVAFSSYIPGDIIAMKIKKGDRYVVSSFGFLAASANIKVSTTTRFKNLFVGGDVFLNEISLDDNATEDGIVWISAYGGFDKITVKAGESVKVDQGLFAFAKKEYDFDVSSIGNIKSFFFSGNTYMMNFHGPCELYVHSNNLNKWIQYLDHSITNKIRSEMDSKYQRK